MSNEEVWQLIEHYWNKSLVEKINRVIQECIDRWCESIVGEENASIWDYILAHWDPSIDSVEKAMSKSYNPAEPRDSKGRWTKGSPLATISPNIGDLAVAGELDEGERAIIDAIPYCSPEILKELAPKIAQSKNATILGDGWIKATLYKIQTALAARLAKVTCHYSRQLHHILQGLPMSFMVADSGSTNIRYNSVFAKERGYTKNCVVCTIAFEARLRGYDVEACPRTKDNTTLSYDPNRIWIDTTGHHPTPIEYTQGTTIGLVYYLEANIGVGQRWTLQYKRKNASSRHIVSVLYTQGSMSLSRRESLLCALRRLYLSVE